MRIGKKSIALMLEPHLIDGPGVVVEPGLVVLEAVPVLAKHGHVPAERGRRSLAVHDLRSIINHNENQYKEC
jgi:hypothetical protein